MRITRHTYFEDEEIVSSNLVDLFCTVLEDAGLGSKTVGNSLILDDVLRTVEEKRLRTTIVGKLFIGWDLETNCRNPLPVSLPFSWTPNASSTNW